MFEESVSGIYDEGDVKINRLSRNEYLRRDENTGEKKSFIFLFV